MTATDGVDGAQVGGERLAYESLTERVMSAIRDGIAAGTYSPDTLYSAYQIAERLGVSRSPVRDALLRLAEDGIVRLERNRGFFVTRPEPQDIAEIFGIRLALEPLAAKRAVALGGRELAEELQRQLARMSVAVREGDEARFSRHDVELHDTILRAAGNHRVAKLISRLRGETRLLGAISARRDRTLSEIHDEHTPIVEAIRLGDGDGAAAAMTRHLINTGNVLLERTAHESGKSFDPLRD